MAVERINAVERETKVEIGHRLGVETDSAHITHIVHIKLGLVGRGVASLGAVAVQAQGNTCVGTAIHTNASRILREDRQIAAQGSEGPRHRLEARGASEFGLGHLQDIKRALGIYHQRKSAQNQCKNFLHHFFKSLF